MQQCPPNPDGPSWGATALAWLTLLAFGLGGLAIPVVSFRASAGRQRLKRLWRLLLGLLGMLAVWLLGLWIFFVFFVLTCATF
ncbi:hypothetical protein DX914_11480 [Lysobacter silvisoli]|uniref:Uncharacterized protein n=2 Tax=Lysobacter silvisoli TaxID=2293254 RepID=A0A371JYZ7_9GAMM|nr:hypothetical protein DX914_11480 [Lysobacter silvisoli]